MSRPAPPRHYPWWVRLIVVGSSSRRLLRFWLALYLVAAIVSVVYGILFEEDLTWGVFFAIVFLALAATHWLTIRWIDRHGSWDF